MKRKLESFINELRSNKKISTFDEGATKQALVLRLLSLLGWDIFDVEEVCPDYSDNSSSVAYALRVKNSCKVFIEVKRVQEKLDNYQKGLIDFASQEGVNLSILTNGLIWWFYLISAKGDWQKKWFLSIDFLKQKPDHIATQLIGLLTKDKISKGQALKTAKVLYEEKNQKIAADFIPQAWNQIISQPNKIFVELLSDSTEKICGHKIESSRIEKYLKKHLDKLLIKIPETIVTPPAILKSAQKIREVTISKDSTTAKAEMIQGPDTYAGKAVKSLKFNENTYKIDQWGEVLTTLCDLLVVKHEKDFEKVLWVSGGDKTYFSRNWDQLSIPAEIDKTEIYVETKLTPDEIVKTAKALIAEFGYSQDKLRINVE
jgi:predicted type IV restriction endonuclease